MPKGLETLSGFCRSTYDMGTSVPEPLEMCLAAVALGLAAVARGMATGAAWPPTRGMAAEV